MSFATDTLTGQQRAVAVLAAILATPGLAEATWTVYPDRLATGRAEIEGQIDSEAGAVVVRAAVNAYASAFELVFDDERFVAGGGHCEPYTSIRVRGVIDGVDVKVWGAAR
jgi:hypothetical protein